MSEPALTLFQVAVLPPWPVFMAFALAGLALSLAPGADMTFVATAAARGGIRRGVIAALGIAVGAFVHIVAAAVGLSALLMASATAFEVLRWVGAAYLLWVAIGIARGGGSEASAAPAVSGWRLFRQAVLVDALNPKVAIFFVAFLPQFIPAGTAHPAPMIIGLGLWFDLVGTVVNVTVAAMAAKAATRLRARPGIVRAARLASAGLIGGLAVKLALDRR